MTSFIVQSVLKLFVAISLFQISLTGRKLSEVVQDQPQFLAYHNGPILSGRNITVNLIWYCKFKPSEKGLAEAPLEASLACPNIYGKGTYPDYAGNLLVDAMTGASFNDHGDNERKYLLPALYDPSTTSWSTLV
ncbi:hypothetical protein V6N11_053301 [Hibiscus sabdariffa]|uniref:Uncharacterized protein n=1 Tax=Hibiscus sabdariffa TaxID=183260 RepID=A0ABR2UCP5_9ROSI